MLENGQAVSSSFALRVPHCAKLLSPAAEPWRSGLLSLRSEFDPEHAFDLRDKELRSEPFDFFVAHDRDEHFAVVRHRDLRDGRAFGGCAEEQFELQFAFLYRGA